MVPLENATGKFSANVATTFVCWGDGDGDWIHFAVVGAAPHPCGGGGCYIVLESLCGDFWLVASWRKIGILTSIGCLLIFIAVISGNLSADRIKRM